MGKKRRRSSKKEEKSNKDEPLVVLVSKGPRHPFHICKNNSCHSLVRVNKIEEKFFPRKVISITYNDPSNNSEYDYSNECTLEGYTCPSCGEFNSLWQHLGEFTASELKEDTNI